MVAHPAVASGIETLLRLERRYDVRRVAKLGEAAAAARAWPADVALVDAALAPRDGRAALGVPTLLLATSDAESAAAARSLDDVRGWVRKDASAKDLVGRVETLLTRPGDVAAGSLAVAAVGALVVVLAGLLLYLAWLAIA